MDLLIEHDPDAPLSKVIGRMFGDERPKLSEAEKRERHLLKLGHPAPHMTKLLMDIGQDLVQESTYSDIVHAKNLPETPKNMETYKQVFYNIYSLMTNILAPKCRVLRFCILLVHSFEQISFYIIYRCIYIVN